jgi:hypothetical protein
MNYCSASWSKEMHLSTVDYTIVGAGAARLNLAMTIT